MTVNTDTIKAIATHEADIRHLQEDVDKLVKSNEIIKTTLVEIQRTLSEAKGGWRVLLLIGGAGGALGSAITAWLTHFGPVK